MREKFKDLGYRVLIASDPTLAFDRFRRQPYDALIVDARTVGEEGLEVFEQILNEAERKRLCCAGVIILGGDQAEWEERLKKCPRGAALVEQDGRGVTIKQLHRKLSELLEEEAH
jgi:DNA-binding response OmpR family regulator